MLFSVATVCDVNKHSPENESSQPLHRDVLQWNNKIKSYQSTDVHVLFGKVRFIFMLAFLLCWRCVTIVYGMTVYM